MAASARVDITADASGVRRGTREAEREISRLSRAGSASFQVLKGSALAAGVAIGTTFAIGVRTGWQELQEAEEASARLNTVLAATKGAAGLTRGELDTLNATLQRNSTLEGDVIMGAQAMLLTFTRIGEEVFPRATQAAVDWARVQKTDVESATKLIGRALQDPEKGLQRLTRAGLTFTEAEKERIRVMVDAGQVQEAQALILAKIESRVGGAERAYGETLPGALEKAKRAFKDFSEDAVASAIEHWPRVKEVIDEVWPDVQRTIGRFVAFVRSDVVPPIRDAVEELRAFWAEWGDEITQVVNLVVRQLRRLWAQVVDIVKLVKAILDGDFSEAWQRLKSIVGRALDGVIDNIRTLGPVIAKAAFTLGKNIILGIQRGLLNLAKGVVTKLGEAVDTAANWVRERAAAIGRAIVDGIADAIRSSPGALRSALSSIVPSASDITDVVLRRRAAGGFIPGTYRGVDDRIAMVASGEAILTPQQQSMIPGGRAALAGIFARTGGVTGGPGFAAGGWVQPVPGGAWRYGPGGGTHSRTENGYRWTDDDAWDIMGSDGMRVYAAAAGRITGTRPFNSDSRYWGHGLYLAVPGGQFFYKHLKTLAVRAGQAVTAGQLLGTLGTGVNGGPHLHLGASPIGLLDLARRGGPVPTGDDPVEEGGGPAERPPGGGGGADGGGRSGRRPGGGGGVFRSGIGAEPRLSTTVDDRITERARDNRIQDLRAGDAGERRAAEEGVTNDEKIRAYRERAVNDVRIGELRADKTDLEGELGRVRARLKALRKGLAGWRRAEREARTAAARTRARERGNQVREAIRDALEEERSLVRQITDVDVDLAVLGYEQGLLNEQITNLPDAEPASGTDTGSTTPAPASSPAPAGGLTPDQERQIRRGQVAENGLVLAEEFIRTAFGPGDLGLGGGSALGAATGGRWVPIRVEAGSFVAALASAAGGQGSVSASFVPSGA